MKILKKILTYFKSNKFTFEKNKRQLYNRVDPKYHEMLNYFLILNNIESKDYDLINLFTNYSIYGKEMKILNPYFQFLDKRIYFKDFTRYKKIKNILND